MPLSADGLKASIRRELDAHLPLPAQRGAAASDRDELAEALADAIVSHITRNATVVGVCPAGGGALVRGRVT